MRRLVALAVVGAIISGLSGAWAFSQLSGSAGAAPSAQQVREQNLDGSGFIRTHEQGTANVNVTNGSLPISGTVNVGNFPAAAQGRLIELGTQPYTINAGQPYRSAFVEVSDCQSITAMARGSETPNAPIDIDIGFSTSPDGIASMPVGDLGVTNEESQPGNVRAGSVHNAATTLRFLRVFVDLGGTAGDQATITAWIWCEP